MRISTGIVSVLIVANIGLSLWLTEKLDQPSVISVNGKVEKILVEKSVVEKNNKPANTVHDSINIQKSNKFGKVIATINNTEVRQIELLPYLNEVVPADEMKKLVSFDDIPVSFLKAAVNGYAIDLLFEELAKDKGVAGNERLQVVIKQNTRRNIRTAYLNTISSTLVNEKQVEEIYNELVNSLKDKKEYRVRHILLATEKEAKIVSEALVQKAHSFDELAKLFSLDETTGFKGGDLGYQVSGQFNPQFEKVIAALDLKRYSKPFKTDVGWHIAVLEDRRKAVPMSYEKASPVIRKNLEQQAIKNYTLQLIDNAEIEIFSNGYENIEN